MKKITIVIIAVMTSVCIKAQNGAHFQFKMSSNKGLSGTMDLNYSELGSLSEMKMTAPQLPGGEMKSKSLSKKNNPDVLYIIDDNKKTYREQKKSAPNTVKEEKEITVKKIGDETVNGYKCVHAIITEGTSITDVWNTKDFADYEKYSSALVPERQMGNAAKRKQALKDAGCDGLPVKTIKKGNEREGEMTMELVKYEKKSFSSSDFEVPSGYTKTEAPAGGYPGMGGQMKSQDEIMKMTPEERTKYIEEMKKKYGK
jgi:hypothetical protein